MCAVSRHHFNEQRASQNLWMSRLAAHTSAFCAYLYVGSSLAELRIRCLVCTANPGYRMAVILPSEVSTYFSHMERMFPQIENDKVPTEQFLRACQGIADFVGKYNSYICAAINYVDEPEENYTFELLTCRNVCKWLRLLFHSTSSPS